MTKANHPAAAEAAHSPPPALIALITALLNIDLPSQLRTLHDLALYDSGDALLGREEKDALEVTRTLADLLESRRDELRKWATVA